VASIQSTRSGRSSSAACELLWNSSTSRAVSRRVSARGAFFVAVFRRDGASRTGLTATAPSATASANMPDRQARAVLAAPGPLFFAIADSARPTTPGVTSRRHSWPKAGFTCVLTTER
jgi:hypothetical protein